MTKQEDTLLLVDGNSVAFRAFFALQNVGSFTNHDGLHTNAIYVFKKILDNILKKYSPTNVLVAFDAGKTTFRTKNILIIKQVELKHLENSVNNFRI
jgi:5''-3'' exonuclease (including N-terminal domain of PolI)